MGGYTVKLAKSAGFCFGVKRAVETAVKIADEQGGCYTYGPLIHNKSEIERLGALGVKVTEDYKDFDGSQGTLIIRSHGVKKSVTDYLSEKGIYISAGSACSSKHKENRVLNNFGLSSAVAD